MLFLRPPCLQFPKRVFRLRLGRRFSEKVNAIFATKDLQLVYPPFRRANLMRIPVPPPVFKKVRRVRPEKLGEAEIVLFLLEVVFMFSNFRKAFVSFAIGTTYFVSLLRLHSMRRHV